MEKTKNIAPHVMACKRCEGKGRIFYLDQGGAPLSAKCPVCNGSGRVKGTEQGDHPQRAVCAG